MKSLRLVLLLAALFLASAPAPAGAKLAHMSWSELLERSDLIVRATMRSGELGDFNSGRAVLSVVETLKGRSTDLEITLSWTSEVHDQRITNLGGDYLLFLTAQEAGGYEAAIYGRSYWPIRLLVGPSLEICEVIDYQHPLTKVELSEKLKAEVEASRTTACGTLAPSSNDRGVLRAAVVYSAIQSGD